MKPRNSRIARLTAGMRRFGRNEFLLGSLVLIVVVAALAATTIVYIHPMGKKTISFETTDASSVREGQDVRVAGVAVGKVTKVSMEPTTVHVDMEVQDRTFIGADTRIEVRMLTPVGGYYVAVIPVGDTPLQDSVIPPERVKMPYSIADVLQAVPRVTDNVDGTVVKADIEQLAAGLEHNSASVGSLIKGLDSIATVMAHQRDQVRTTLDLTAEYLQTFNGSRDFVFQLVEKVNIVLATYYTYRDGFNETYELLGDALIRLIPVEEYYLNHKQELLDAVNQARDAFKNMQDAINPVVDQLTGMRAQLESLLTPEGLATLGGGKLLASEICIPIPGRMC
ncbi:MlaD family protein [Rhodococcus sp. NM-2]|uniref:MlaD family protein n=1 Tax=Rhodococcus sp. NM-2 TaxID=3401174 RepID=UPI003AAF26F9